MKPRVFVTRKLPGSALELLRTEAEVDVWGGDTPPPHDVILDKICRVDGLLCLLTDRIDSEVIHAGKQLKVISNYAVGFDNIDVPAASARRIPVGNTPDVLTEGTADLTMTLLLGIARRLPKATRDAAEGRWQTWSPTGWLGADISGATLGIVGMGKIGLALAKRAAGFGMNIIYSDPKPNTEADSSLRGKWLPLEELLEQSDFVSLHTPLTPQTHHLINEGALIMMKPSAILVNTARGPIVDTQALVKALSEGWIKAAALDVTDPEPLPPDHQLYKLSNCLISPHIGSATWNTRRLMAQRACDNLLAGLRGERLPYCANPDVYQ